MMRRAAIACVVAMVGGCRCGHRAQPESNPPSNEASSTIAYGLDWLPADTTVVARFGPGYGFMTRYMEEHPDVPECAWALTDSVTASYMVHRYIADPPIKAAIGDLPRQEIEACIAATFSAEVRAGSDERLTQVTRGTQTTWIGWADGMAVWHDDLDRVLEVLDTRNRLAPNARMAQLVGRLQEHGGGVATTADFSLALFGVPSIGLVSTVERGTTGSTGRFLFASSDDANAMMAAYARRIEDNTDSPAELGDQLWRLLEPVVDGNEVVMSLALAWDHPASIIKLAEWIGVPTRPE